MEQTATADPDRRGGDRRADGLRRGRRAARGLPGQSRGDGAPARTTAALTPDDVGREVALLFEGGDPARPLVVGRLVRPEATPVAVVRDGVEEVLQLTAEREIVLRCGKASITLTRAGKVLIRGEYIFSRSTGVNKMKGGSIQLN